jgi:EpsI family protein
VCVFVVGTLLCFVAGERIFHGLFGLRADSPLSSRLAYFGRNSIEIYLVHIIAGSGVRIVLGRPLGIADAATHLVLGTAFGVGLPLFAGPGTKEGRMAAAVSAAHHGEAGNELGTSDMNILRVACLLAGLMCAASLGAMLARPSAKAADLGPPVVLDSIVPKQFGEWKEQPQLFAQVVNPQTQALLDKLYSQILSRTYVNAQGERVMLSLAYGSDQRGELQAHKPEVCYPSQGFTVHANTAASISTAFGDIPVRQLSTSMGSRHEPVTYWFTVGDRIVEGVLYKRFVEMRYGLTGQIPDGLLFRISSIDPEPSHAFDVHRRFVNELLEAVPLEDRKRLSGLGAGPRG